MVDSPPSAQREDKGLEIALVGAGVCGLTCVLALAKYGVSVQVFEAAVRLDLKLLELQSRCNDI